TAATATARSRTRLVTMHSSGVSADRARGSLWREILPVQTKGHRVIAMPLCSTDLAPPAFTAPCRNQISDCAHSVRNGRARSISSKNGETAHMGSRERPQISCVFLQICPWRHAAAGGCTHPFTVRVTHSTPLGAARSDAVKGKAV